MPPPRRESSLPLEPDDAALASLARTCLDFALERWRTLGEAPSFDLDGAEAVAATFRNEPAPEEGEPIEEILARLGPAFAKSFNTAGPGYLAFIPGGGIPSAALADLVSLALNRYVGVRAAAPALADIETATVAWLAREMGYPESARGILTSGGSLSNLTAITTARETRLAGDFRTGAIYFSSETHLCVEKAARVAGFPAESLRRLPVDSRRRLLPDALRAAIASDRAAGRKPFLVVANAGTTNTGAVDPLAEIVGIARENGLWTHADAAYGGFFRLAPEGVPILRGIEECDSITLDPHKGLFLPYGTGCLLVRDGGALLRAHRGEASYLQDVAAAGDAVNLTDLSPELSRDFRGLRLWLPIRLHGLAAFRSALEEKLALARAAYGELRDDPLFDVLDEPQLSVVAFAMKTRGGDANAVNAELLRRVNARRRVFLSSTTLEGRYVLRICVLSFRTHEERLREAVAQLREEALKLDRETAGLAGEAGRRGSNAGGPGA